MIENLSDRDLDRIDREASEWIVLSEGRELDKDEKSRFAAWLAEDPRHEEIFEEMQATWATVPNLTALERFATGAKPTGALSTKSPSEKVTFFASKRASAGVIAVAASLIAVLAIPYQFWRNQHHFETDLAETRTVVLSDGSRVTLGAETTLDVKFQKDRRHVELASGEAFFEVTKDRARPFFVEVGPSLVRVVGTKFNVNYNPNSVQVSVMEGVVQVRGGLSRSMHRPIQILRSGEKTELSIVNSNDSEVERSSTLFRAVVPSRAQAPGAWREGRLAYDDGRLADLVADVNRYYEPGLALSDPKTGNLRITASFSINEISAFISAMPKVVPVNVEEQPNGHINITPATAKNRF